MINDIYEKTHMVNSEGLNAFPKTPKIKQESPITPLLFTILLEVLTRAIRVVKDLIGKEELNYLQ